MNYDFAYTLGKFVILLQYLSIAWCWQPQL